MSIIRFRRRIRLDGYREKGSAYGDWRVVEAPSIEEARLLEG